MIQHVMRMEKSGRWTGRGLNLLFVISLVAVAVIAYDLMATEAPAATVDIGTVADVKIAGASPGGRTGSAVATGDLDGDGKADLVIGSDGFMPSGMSEAGITSIIFGPLPASGGIDLLGSVPDVTINGEASGDLSGRATAVGDLNNDGQDDLIIGAPGATTAGGAVSGKTFVLFGPISSGTFGISTAHAVIAGLAADDRSGTSVAGGDLNGDGIDDLTIGAPGTDISGGADGAVHVIFGPLAAGTSTLAAADISINSSSSAGQLGSSVAVGDFDLDGVNDLFIGQQAAGVGGVLNVLPGPITAGTYDNAAEQRFIIKGGASGDRLGAAVAIQDLDGDGVSDVLLGAPGDEPSGPDTNVGMTYTFFGPNPGASTTVAKAHATWNGATVGDAAGTAIATGDMDDDGTVDVIVGVPFADTSGREDNGVVMIVQGESSPSAGSVSGNVFHDADSDDEKDGGEADHSGWTVSLRNAVGTLVATSTTDGSGNYLFSSVTPGTYTVAVAVPGSWEWRLPTGGSVWIWPSGGSGDAWVWNAPSSGGRLVRVDSGKDVSGINFGTKLGPVLIHVVETMGVDSPMGGVIPGPQIHVVEALTVNIAPSGEPETPPTVVPEPLIHVQESFTVNINAGDGTDSHVGVIPGPLIHVRESFTVTVDTFGEMDPPSGNGSITGQITLQGIVQPSRLLATGAFVVAQVGLTGTTTMVSVRSDGTFEIPNLPPASYNLTAAADGFVHRSLNNVVVSGSEVVLASTELRGGLVNGDNVVTITDISAVAASFGQSMSGRADGQGRFVDIDANGMVDILDISNVASNFGVTSAQGWAE